MPSSPYVIRLDDAERAELEFLSRRATAPHRMVLRARIVLLAADDTANSEIARRLGTCEDTARKWAAADRLTSAYPNAQMVHLPVHASWLNQVEVYFSVIQRKLLTPDDFEGLVELAEQILAFEKHYNAAARPSDWRFTRADLNKLLTRIWQHDRHAPHPTAV